MKARYFIVLVCLAAAIVTRAQPSTSANTARPTPPRDTPYAVVSRDANSRIWERTTYEKRRDGQWIPHVHRYNEIATGLHYRDESGNWLDSKEDIELSPNGGAEAVHGQHRVFFPSDLYDGVIELITPDGEHLKSRPIGISYFDGTKSVLIAELTHSTGQIVSANQVLYTNAFSDFAADLLVTYRKSGLECDLVFRDRLPAPEVFGLDSNHARLELLTEFFDTPTPHEFSTVEDTTQGLQDSSLAFGSMTMVRGKAFRIGSQDEGAGAPRIPVYKTWTQLGGRTVLIEEVPYKSIEPSLQTLSAPTGASATVSMNPMVHKVSALRLLPPARIAQTSTNTVHLAKAELNIRPGVVLDYNIVNSQTNMTFQGDTTYYVSDTVNLYGTTVVEGGTIIKYDTNTACVLNILGTIECETAPYHPAVFTSVNDGSVGQAISSSGSSCVGPLNLQVQNDVGSDLTVYVYDDSGNYLIDGSVVPAGTSQTFNLQVGSGQHYVFDSYDTLDNEYYEDFWPTLQNGNMEASTPYYTESGSPICASMPPSSTALALENGGSLHDLFIRYLGVGIESSADYSVTNMQFVQCQNAAFQTENASLYAGNVLISGSSVGFGGQAFNVQAEQLTYDQGTYVAYDSVSSNSAITLVNGLITDVSSYGNALVSTSATVRLASNVGVYQTVGAGSHYLGTNSPYRNAGTNGINPMLLAELAQKTTYPPTVYSNVTISASEFGPQVQRDNDIPDLGYHYDPLDWCFGGVTANGNVTFDAGTAVGYFETAYGNGYGIALANDVTNTFNGTFTAPCVFARYSTVQEGNGNWTSKGWLAGITTVGNSSYFEEIDAKFTQCYELNGDPNFFRDFYAQLNVHANECEFHSGSIAGYWLGTFMTNCLFDRLTAIGSEQQSAGVFWRNCTMHGGMVYVIHSWNPTWPVWIENCVFDGSTSDMDDNSGGNTNITYCNYNGFVNGAQRLVVQGQNDVVVTDPFIWQAGPLGNWYQAPDSPFIDQGSLTADRVGLYEYTTQTSASSMEGRSIVDLGYHYLALDAQGNPVSTLVNGVADYISDTDGNGLPDAWEIEYFGHIGVDPYGDPDGDGMNNIAEFTYGSNPTNANTFNTVKTDPEYLFTAFAGQSGVTMMTLSIANGADGFLQLSVTGALSTHTYDLYYVDNILAQRWQWRRVYCGIQPNSSGSATFLLQQPESSGGYFVLLDANDDDSDGLGNGYESWFTYSGRYSNMSVADTDGQIDDGWNVAYGLDPTATTGIDSPSGDPDGDNLSNLQEYTKNPTFGTPAYDPLRNFNTQPSRSVVSISSSTPNASGPQNPATFTIQRSGGDQSAALTVYYAVGGNAIYNVDYTLSPIPPEYPRIFSAQIPATQSSVTVTLTPAVLRATGADSAQVVVKLTPYAVSPSPQVSDPTQWLYVVNVFQDTVTLNLFNTIPGVNGPIYAIKVYETSVMNGNTCGEYHQIIVGGQFTQAGSVAATNIARWDNISGTWQPLGNGINGPVYAIEAVQRSAGDTSPDVYVGGNFTAPFKAMAKWSESGGTWSQLGSGLTSTGFLKTTICRVNAIKKMSDNTLWVGGRFFSAGGVQSENLAKWNLTSSLWQALGGTLTDVNSTTTINESGIPGQTIMVTAIDPSEAAIGVATNGSTCATCTASFVESEAYYNVQSSGTALVGQGRTAAYAGMRAISGGVAGHDELNPPATAPVSFETTITGLKYSGLSQLVGSTWRLLGGGGSATPPCCSPYWPASGSLPDGWKVVGPVDALAQSGSDIYFGGSFNILSGAYSGQQIADYSGFNNVFHWNTGTGTWSMMANPSTISCVVPGATGVNGPVYAMAVESSLCTGLLENIWFAGNFSQAGGGAVANIAPWASNGANPNPTFYWNVPPTPSIVSPSGGAVFTAPVNVSVLATFAATGCTIAKVEFYENNTLLASLTTSPYSFTWNAVPRGVHTVVAVATDGTGRIAFSAPITFTVQ